METVADCSHVCLLMRFEYAISVFELSRTVASNISDILRLPAVTFTSRESPCISTTIKRPKYLKHLRSSVVLDVASCYLFAMYQGFGGST